MVFKTLDTVKFIEEESLLFKITGGKSSNSSSNSTAALLLQLAAQRASEQTQLSAALSKVGKTLSKNSNSSIASFGKILEDFAPTPTAS